MKKFKAPLRIDFAGGWTDIPYLIKETNGYVSNVAIRPLVAYPRGMGLSTSTSIKLSEMIELKNKKEYLKSRNLEEIAEDLFNLENRDLNWAIGRQDPYSIVFGGFNCFKFSQDSAEIVNLKIPNNNIEKLEKRLVLFYSGVSRDAQKIVEQVYRNFNLEKEKSSRALDKIKECGLKFSQSLERGDLDQCGRIMSANWWAQKELANNSSNKELDEIYDFAFQNGAQGGKLCGAGGGGCFVFYIYDKENLKKALEAKFKKGFVMPFSFEFKDIKKLYESLN